MMIVSEWLPQRDDGGIAKVVLLLFQVHKGVSKNRGGPPKWMVKIMENPIF